MKGRKKTKTTLQICFQGLWFVYSSLQSIILLGTWEFGNMDRVVGNTSLILEVLTQQQSFKNYSHSANHFSLPFLIIFLSRQTGKNIHATKISTEVSSHAWVSELCWTHNWLRLSCSIFLRSLIITVLCVCLALFTLKPSSHRTE